MLKHYKKTNWIYCTFLTLDPRHKAETFEFTPWGVEIKKMSLKTFETIHEDNVSQKPISVELPTVECADITDSDKNIIDFNTLYSTPFRSRRY